jgi:hypothetical protein
MDMIVLTAGVDDCRQFDQDNEARPNTAKD